MSLGELTPDCPHCGRALPSIQLTATLDGRQGDTLIVTLEPVFGAAFYKRVRLAHPWCFGGKDDGEIDLAVAV